MTATGADWMRARKRAIGMLRRRGWGRDDAEDAASEALCRLLPGGLYSGTWWYMWRLSERMLRQRPRGANSPRAGGRAGAGVAPRASAAMRLGDDLPDPGAWIAERVAAGPESFDDEPRTTARDLAYLGDVAGLTGEEIASALGCTDRAIRKWRTGAEPRQATREAVAALADGYRRAARADLERAHDRHTRDHDR